MTEAEREAREIIKELLNPELHPFQHEWSDAHSLTSEQLIRRLAEALKKAEERGRDRDWLEHYANGRKSGLLKAAEIAEKCHPEGTSHDDPCCGNDIAEAIRKEANHE